MFSSSGPDRAHRSARTGAMGPPVGGPATSPALQSRLRRLKELEDLGAELLICVADVSDPAQMAAAVAAAGQRSAHSWRHPRRRRARHARPAAPEVARMGRSGSAAQVEGTLVLDELFAASRLDFLVLCSSIGHLVRIAGHERLFIGQRLPGCVRAVRRGSLDHSVVSIGWDSWRDVGFAVALGGDPDAPARCATPSPPTREPRHSGSPWPRGCRMSTYLGRTCRRC